jgi:hypothetical protein
VHIGYQRRLMRCSINTTLYRYCAWQLSGHGDGCLANHTKIASGKDGTLESHLRPSLALLQGVHAGRQCPGCRHRAGMMTLNYLYITGSTAAFNLAEIYCQLSF